MLSHEPTFSTPSESGRTGPNPVAKMNVGAGAGGGTLPTWALSNLPIIRHEVN